MVLKTMWSDFTMLPNMRRIDRARHPLPYSKEPTTDEWAFQRLISDLMKCAPPGWNFDD